jgi:hypothetical protein
MKSLDSRQSILRSAASAIGSAANATVETVLLDINTILGSGTAGQLFISNGTGVPFFSSTVAQATTFGTTSTNFDDYALIVRGDSTTSHSVGLLIRAGTNSSDYALTVRNSAATSDFLTVRGDGRIYTPFNTLDDGAGNATIANEIGIGTNPIGTSKVRVAGADTSITGPNATGFAALWTANSNNTSNVIGFTSGPTTAASTTVSHVTGFESDGVTVGAGGSVIRVVDFLAAGYGALHGTNNAGLADNQSFTGNFFINQAGGYPSSFANGGFQINASGNLFLEQATSAAFIDFQNNGNPGFITVGAESGAGGSIFAGTTAYAGVFGTTDANPVQIATHNTVALTVDTAQNLTVAGLAGVGTRPLSVTSTGKLTSGASAYTAPTVQKFTSGSGTYTTPANVLYIKVRMVGGGGGGSGNGTGGTGGNTTFGSSFLTANGGAANVGGTASIAGGASGFAVTGGSGGAGPAIGASFGTFNGVLAGGQGAASPFGGAGASGEYDGTSSGHPGTDAVANTGSGGGGGSVGGSPGSIPAGGGAGGYVDALVGSPSATYSYSIGAGGASGTGGGGTAHGGVGGSGFIIVEEFYQ